MKKYKCIKEFEIEKCDGDGCFNGHYATIKLDSIWELSEDKNTITGLEYHLDRHSKKTYFWVELSKKELDEYFEEIV